MQNKLIVIRGAGDLATGVAVRLKNAGFDILMTDIKKPTVIRRTVAFAQAFYDKEITVENITARIVKSEKEQIIKTIKNNEIPLIADEKLEILKQIQPFALVDAIIAKKNLGTKIDMANIVIALGPGFTAGVDCHAVIETNRGHDLGRVIFNGNAQKDTGIPGVIAGYGKERVVRSTCAGKIRHLAKIADIVSKNQEIIEIEKKDGKKEIIRSPLDGVLRGLLHEGLEVFENMKIADVDPRGNKENCFGVSDKARAIGGGVLEAVLSLGDVI